jgi:plastocyanin
MRGRTIARAITVFGLAASLVLPAAGVAEARERVRARDNEFRPRRVTVSVNERVVWRNTGNNPHTVTAYRGDWSKDSFINPGERTRFRFRRAGRYKYLCTIHAFVSGGQCVGMCGRVTVG